jgi:hypothetical protein
VALPFADACRRLGVELVEEPVGIVPKQSEYEALAKTIADSGADIVSYGGIIQNGAEPLWRDIRTAAPAITMMGPDTLFEHAFIQDAGAHAEGTLITFGGVRQRYSREKVACSTSGLSSDSAVSPNATQPPPTTRPG